MSQLNTSISLEALEAVSHTPQTQKINLLGCTETDMTAKMLEAGEKPFRGQQLFRGVFVQRTASFAEITTFPHALRQSFSEIYTLARPHITTRQVSEDGTRKYQFLSDDGLSFEAVYIPEVAKERSTNTLCISSQTGCAVGCRFCFTASIRRNRNLTAAEIIGQVMAVQDDLALLGDSARVTNIVYMGMGEPLLNYEQVVQSARILLDRNGLNFSNRRVTISTSGIVPRIYDLGRDLPTQLAISLNATTDKVRSQLMPINKKWPLFELLNALKAYPLSKRRRITIEYVLLRDINDSEADAHRLIQLLRDIPVKINLLPLNPHDQTPYQTPPWERILVFQNILHSARYITLIRTARGQDIDAACGQLGGAPLPQKETAR